MSSLGLLLWLFGIMFFTPTAGWRSYCHPNPEPYIPSPVDCESPLLTWIDKCFCEHDVTKYRKCAKEVLDELEPEHTTPTIVYEISVILERLSRIGTLEPETKHIVWQLYDKVLDVRQSVFERSNDDQRASTQRLAKSFLTSLDRFMREADIDTASYMNGTNIALLKKPQPECGNNSALREGIADYGSHFGQLGDSGGMEEPLASIEVPSEAICKPANGGGGIFQVNSDEGLSSNLFFVLHRKPHFFLGNSSQPANGRFGRSSEPEDRQRVRCQPGLFAGSDRIVLSASLDNVQKQMFGNGSDQQTMAKISYRKQSYPALHGQYLVTWWNVSESSWSEDGSCKLEHKGDLLQAECSHLTDFTLLVNGLETDPSLCDGFLIALGYVLNLASFLALALLNAVYVIYKRPALYQRVFVHWLGNRLPRMQLDTDAVFYNVTLMFFYFSFAIFSDEQHTGSGGVFCRAVAAFNYWLLLACILLTIFQAWRILKMFLWTVALERAIIVATRRRYKLSICFGLPLLLCALFSACIDDFFYRDDEFCWIRPSYVWFSVVLPLSVLVLNALLCSVIICVRLFPNSCGMQRVLERHASSITRLAKGVRKQSQQKLTVLVLMQFSLGMPWVLQFATLSIPGASIFHFLFTLVNGSQGIMLLSLFGYKQIQAWRSERRKSRRAEEATTTPVESPKAENRGFFTNSIGMRIPVAKPPSSDHMEEEKKAGELPVEEHGKY